MPFSHHCTRTDANGTPIGSSPAHFMDARPQKYEPQLSLMPVSYTKTITFIRHGEGFHNAGINTPDSHLTLVGWRQAHALGAHMGSMAPCNGVQVGRVVGMPAGVAAAAAVGTAGACL
jgi:hypothetical protein